MGKINEKWGPDIAVMDCGHRLVPVPLDKEVGDEYDCILCAELQAEKENKTEDNAPWVKTETKPPQMTPIWVWRKGEVPIPATFAPGNPKARLQCFRDDVVFLLDGGNERLNSFDSWKYLSPPKPPNL